MVKAQMSTSYHSLLTTETHAQQLDMHTVTPCAPSSVMLLAACMDSVIGQSQRHTDVCSHEQPLFLRPGFNGLSAPSSSP